MSRKELPTDAQIVTWLSELPWQALREVERIGFHKYSSNNVLGTYQRVTRRLSFAARPDGWKSTGLISTLTAHEAAGHGIEGGDATLFRLLMEAAVLDADAGTPFAARRYGNTNIAEHFATLIEDA